MEIMILYTLFTLLLIALIIASITDIQKKEVPDYLSYALIAIGLILRGAYSLATSDYKIILEGIAGFGLMFGLGYLLYHTAQWGGGDSKILMGIGAIIGIPLELTKILTSENMLFSLLINILLVGAVYSIIFTIVISIKKIKTIKGEFLKELNESKYVKYILLGILIIFTLLSLLLKTWGERLLVILIALLINLQYLLFILLKTTEKHCFIKTIKTEKLTEGDWIYKDIIIKGKKICGPKDNGITQKQINELIHHKIKEVTIKDGIPFIPAILISYIVTLWIGNIIGAII